VSWGKVNPGVLPDTVVAYCDSTIAFPLFAEYAVASKHGKRKVRGLFHKTRSAGRGSEASGQGRAYQAEEEAGHRQGQVIQNLELGIQDSK